MQHEVLLDIKCASFYSQGSALVATREKIDGTEAVHCCSITDFYCPLHSTRLMNPKDKLLDCAELDSTHAHLQFDSRAVLETTKWSTCARGQNECKLKK